MKARYIYNKLLEDKDSRWGRIIVLTGARQTGKTTVAKSGFPDYSYLSVEDPVMRSRYATLSSQQWKMMYPKAILDEVQKEPSLIESIKSVYDQWNEPRYVLTGSSQLLLMNKVKESLAGRCIISEIYPLTVPELETDTWDSVVSDSPFQTLLYSGIVPDTLPSFLLDPQYARKIKAWNHYVSFGGYPALTDESMTDEDRYRWLSTYVRTYLERDVRDLASFRDLEPYIKLQQSIALQTGSIFNASTLSTRVGVSAKTVKTYMQYLEISYQTLTLHAWERNESKRLVKSPKVHYLDYGVLQAVTGKRGMPTGMEFESMVISELFKQAKQTGLPVRFYYIRTASGIETDCLIETEKGYYAFEIKQTEHVQPSDAKHLRIISGFLDKPLLHGFVLSNDTETLYPAENITALNVAWFLG